MKLNSPKLKSPFLVKPSKSVKLSSLPTEEHGKFRDKEAAEKAMKGYRKELEELQEVFYASQAKALLIVLQGMDTAGKDGTIRGIFSGVNPQGCQVAAFKVPTALEARHDFLWRCQRETPPRGMIGIFNRSHYEDVLSPVVHGTMSSKVARQHMDDINSWESTLVDNNVVVLKFFLHISHGEQTRRLQARIDDPKKHWKISPADFSERRFWDGYMECYEGILSRTSHKHAPWFVIPADHKWFRDIAIAEILVDCLRGLKLEYPASAFDPSGIVLANESVKAAAREVAAREEKGNNSQDKSRPAEESGAAPRKKTQRVAATPTGGTRQ